MKVRRLLFCESSNSNGFVKNLLMSTAVEYWGCGRVSEVLAGNFYMFVYFSRIRSYRSDQTPTFYRVRLRVTIQARKPEHPVLATVY